MRVALFKVARFALHAFWVIFVLAYILSVPLLFGQPFWYESKFTAAFVPVVFFGMMALLFVLQAGYFKYLAYPILNVVLYRKSAFSRF